MACSESCLGAVRPHPSARRGSTEREQFRSFPTLRPSVCARTQRDGERSKYTASHAANGSDACGPRTIDKAHVAGQHHPIGAQPLKRDQVSRSLCPH